MLEQTKIAFIGSGKMGEAMIKGLLAGEIVTPNCIVASDPIEGRRRQMEAEYGVSTTDSNVQAIEGANVVVLSVYPQIFPKVSADLYGELAPDTLILSIMAGVPVETIRSGLNHSCIVRSIPNTPAQVGKGITIWTATPVVTANQRANAAAMLGAFGEQIAVDDEKYLDMATGLSGSGPGFVFLLIEALIDAGVQIGFSRPDAQKMVLQTIDGSIELVRATGLHPAELRNRVTSAGGTTAAGLYEMEAGGVRATLARAVMAAYHRSQELGAAYNKKDGK